jgi:hypothetical protein
VFEIVSWDDGTGTVQEVSTAAIPIPAKARNDMDDEVPF